jgi:hypothetical protein
MAPSLSKLILFHNFKIHFYIRILIFSILLAHGLPCGLFPSVFVTASMQFFCSILSFLPSWGLCTLFSTKFNLRSSRSARVWRSHNISRISRVFLILICESLNRIIGTETRLHSGQTRNRASILRSRKRFSSSPKHPHQVWGPTRPILKWKVMSY